MYENKFVASLKSEGKVLKEKNGTIEFPFGNQYSILLKNLESRNAVVSIDIDGEDILDGKRLIVKPNSDLELEGFMNGQTAKNKFRFIKRTQDIEDHRGINASDGLIRIEFQFEKMKPVIQDTYYNYKYWWYNPWIYQPYYPYHLYEPTVTWNNTYSIDQDCVSVGTSVASTDAGMGATSGNYQAKNVPSLDFSEEPGITTKGSYINQKFGTGYTDPLEEQLHTIILKLSGYTKKGVVVEKLILSREKIRCPVCGTMNRSNHDFCFKCSTALQ